MTRILLRPDEAAEALGISRSRCYKLIAEGVLPSCRIGQSIRVPLDALEQLVATSTTGNLVADTDENGDARISVRRWR